MSPRPRLVLLPAVGHDGRLYSALAQQLEDHVEVVPLDFPEFDSEAGAFDYLAPDLVGRLLQHFASAPELRHAGPLCIGGISLGATLCLRLKSLLPTPPSALLLMACGGLPAAKIRRDTVLEAMTELGDEGFARRHLALDAETGPGQHLGTQSPEASAYFAYYGSELWSERQFVGRARTAAALLRAALAIDYRDEMQRNQTPAHVVWGTQDRVFNRKYVDRLVCSLGCAQFHPLEGVGHYPALEAPRQVAKIVRAALPPQEKT